MSEAFLEFVVIGTPVPQGSKTRTRWGMREDNPNTKPWRATVAAEAALAWRRELLSEPVAVEATFVFSRLKSHFGTGRNEDVLKASAPFWHRTKPDGDKLARAVGDALTGTVLRDDSQIVSWTIRKVYGSPARAVLRILEPDPLDAFDAMAAGRQKVPASALQPVCGDGTANSDDYAATASAAQRGAHGGTA